MEKSIWQQLKPTNQFQRTSIVSYLLKKQEILRRYKTKSFFLHLSPWGHSSVRGRHSFLRMMSIPSPLSLERDNTNAPRFGMKAGRVFLCYRVVRQCDFGGWLTSCRPCHPCRPWGRRRRGRRRSRTSSPAGRR